MESLACVNTPNLRLQIALKKHPDWRSKPVAILDQESNKGRIVELNKIAKNAHLNIGIRYLEALAALPNLQIEVISKHEIEQYHKIFYALIFDQFSPEIEPSHQQPGLFWIRTTGLAPLFGSLKLWGKQLFEALKNLGFLVSISMGTERFATYCIALAQKVGVFGAPNREAELQLMLQAPLELFALDYQISVELLCELHRLRIYTVGDLSKFPGSSIQERFGKAIFAIFKESTELSPYPFLALHERHFQDSFDLEIPLSDYGIDEESNVYRLLFIIKEKLHKLMLHIASSGLALGCLEIHLFFVKNINGLEDIAPLELQIKPQAPTLDEIQVIELVRLKLEQQDLKSAVSKLVLKGIGAEALNLQNSLFNRVVARRIEDANLALDKIRSEYGPESVLTYQEEAELLPESSYRMVPLTAIKIPCSTPPQCSLIRRIYREPIPLERYRPNLSKSWFINGLDGGPIVKEWGPYQLCNGWWDGETCFRTYYYLQNQYGDIFWVFFDHRKTAWFLQGEVG